MGGRAGLSLHLGRRHRAGLACCRGPLRLLVPLRLPPQLTADLHSTACACVQRGQRGDAAEHRASGCQEAGRQVGRQMERCGRLGCMLCSGTTGAHTLCALCPSRLLTRSPPYPTLLAPPEQVVPHLQPDRHLRSLRRPDAHAPRRPHLPVWPGTRIHLPGSQERIGSCGCAAALHHRFAALWGYRRLNGQHWRAGSTLRCGAFSPLYAAFVQICSGFAQNRYQPCRVRFGSRLGRSRPELHPTPHCVPARSVNTWPVLPRLVSTAPPQHFAPLTSLLFHLIDTRHRHRPLSPCCPLFCCHLLCWFV